ncbi:hypothetical protein QE152_g6357 [Popillia japonica]|uniref:Shavenoid isoform B-like N-terminal domain-containing protein n=1 Tax=Popillia japonica TaxID=7064 RepID=A0AAW1MJ70_POPJA
MFTDNRTFSSDDTRFTKSSVDCNSDTCIGLSSGTAATVPQQPQQSNRKTCLCQCHSHLPAFREDLQICVDDIRECVVAPFVSGSTAQQIPFVFLPLRGQIIHPSKEISFAGVATPICAVSGAKFLTESGWVDLRNPLETDVPFRLYRDEGRTFLQWEGESILRNRMSGRMVLVHLKCKDLDTDTDSGQELEAEFSPCVAFRVVGTPLKYPNKFAKMLFPPDAQSSDASNKIEQNVSENLIFAIASIILGLIYGVVAFLYLNLRKKRQLGDVKLGVQVVPNLSRLERGIVKDNPLVKLEECYLAPISFRNDSELKNDGSQGEGDDHDDELHRYANDIYEQINPPNYPTITFEKLPEEGVSIVETLDVNENHIKNVPTLLPSYILQNPPPQAIEFLIKMRGVIRAAKERMLANKFSPNLLDIPEEYPVSPICWIFLRNIQVI